MTGIKIEEPVQEFELHFHLDLLFEIYKLKLTKKRLISELESIEKLLKSGINSKWQYRFEALKFLIRENHLYLKNNTEKVDYDKDLFALKHNLRNSKKYLETIKNEHKKHRIDLGHYEITKGFYLQKIIDIQDKLKQLATQALSYCQELKDDLITLEDQHIVLKTEKLRKKISKEKYKEKHEKIKNEKKKIEDKIAFLKVEIIDYEFD
ncbi:MAG: hypothetical protein ACXAEX_06490 [Promethearchaeota archaeon]|jgi:hypothetical protein